MEGNVERMKEATVCLLLANVWLLLTVIKHFFVVQLILQQHKRIPCQLFSSFSLNLKHVVN